MKNVIVSDEGIQVRGNARGSIVVTFGLIFIICWIMTYFGTLKVFGVSIGQPFLILGVLLLLIGTITSLIGRKTIYLEVKEDKMYAYTSGAQHQYYIIPLERIAYVAKVHKQRSRNTEVFVVAINNGLMSNK